jgi:hypothetical protein
LRECGPTAPHPKDRPGYIAIARRPLRFFVHREIGDVRIGDMLAVEAPVKKLLVVGGVALALAAGVALRPHHTHARSHHRHRLTLHADSEPSATYYTMFANGDVWVDSLPAMHTQVRMRYRVETPDSCYWDVTEKMMRVEDNRLLYMYDEQPAGCEPDADPSFIATPRIGEVMIDE